MRSILLCAAALLAVPAAAQPPTAAVVLDNAQVRVFRAGGTLPAGLGRQPGVIVFVGKTAAHQAGDAVWVNDVAAATDVADGAQAVVVAPKRFAAAPLPKGEPASQPGEATFTGMSFKTILENDRVAVIRARMEAGATEAFHTHASDTVVVHLSGGSIEDTAGGVTKVNRWKHGDVEFEARGSSHSARNVGDAIDVVLVTLKPQAR